MQRNFLGDQVKNENVFSANFPDRLYQYLQQNNLIDGHDHEYSIDDDGKKLKVAIRITK